VINHLIDVNGKKYEVIKERVFMPDVHAELMAQKENWPFDELVIDGHNKLILYCNEVEEAKIISETSASVVSD